MNRWKLIIGSMVIAALIVSGCSREEVAEPFQPADSHERYREALQTLGIGDSALAEQWLESAEEALEDPTPVLPPVTETVYFDPREGEAASFMFPVPRGQEVTVSLETGVSRYFAEIFRVSNELQGERLETPVHIASASSEGRIVFVPQRSGRYLLRVQPEILRGGRFDIQIDADASLAWPVPGTDASDVWSYFGDDRDGGRRVHHGIDIFAEHGTPVVAVSRSRVRSVGQRDRGGNVVTLFDERLDINIYYAHLSEQTTERGLRVSAGDQIGLMGKSGNARNTPAHLHIGIYDGGWGRPVDPWYFFVDGESEPPAPPEEEVAELGAWVRTAAGGVSAVTHPPASWGGVPSPAVVDARGNPLRSPETPPTELSRGEEVTLSGLLPVRASGIRGDDLRVLTVDGQVLYADRASIEPLTQPVATLTVRAGRYLRTAPSVTAPVIGRTDADTELEVLGFHESYAMVRGAGETRPAWLWLPERGGRTL